MKSKFHLFSLVISLFLLTNNVFPQDCPKNNRVEKTIATISQVELNINNIATTFQNDGITDAKNPGGGLEFPKGSSKIAGCVTSLLWGVNTGSIPSVGGSFYRSGLQPGRILSVGKAEDPANPSFRVFRVRPDYKSNSLDNEVARGEGTTDLIKNKYEKDWNEWPGNIGAPFLDKNNNGTYEPEIDTPGYPNASQTIWFVANDLDGSKVANLYGSKPIGLELQVTAWAYNSSNEALKNTIFRKYRLINKSGSNLNDIYLNFYTDIDVGYNNQLCGSDSTLNLGYGYAGLDDDKIYGSNLPAVGLAILQGPIINGKENDIGIFNGKKVKGKKNLGMTAFFHFFCGSNFFACPRLYDQSGAISYYNYFKGYEGISPIRFQVPQNLGGRTTMFTFNGDPITQTGWVDGYPGGERYENITSGPFDLAAGETQEIVVAQIGAFGKNRLDAINVLKDYTRQVTTNYYDNIFDNGMMIVDVKEKSIPGNFSLHQNYPNPFNPETTIDYQITEAANVSLKVYDILGREVATLVEEFKQPGIFNSKFSILNSQLPSGVYFYRLEAGNYVANKKMVLMK